MVDPAFQNASGLYSLSWRLILSLIYPVRGGPENCCGKVVNGLTYVRIFSVKFIHQNAKIMELL